MVDWKSLEDCITRAQTATEAETAVIENLSGQEGVIQLYNGVSDALISHTHLEIGWVLATLLTSFLFHLEEAEGGGERQDRMEEERIRVSPLVHLTTQALSASERYTLRDVCMFCGLLLANAISDATLEQIARNIVRKKMN